jgi:hypothetical protein
MNETVECGRVSLKLTEPGRVMLNIEGPHSVCSFEAATDLFLSDDEAADLFAALAEYLPLRADEREEERVAGILAAIGATDTPD